MNLLGQMANWLQGEDFALPGDALVVMDGENFEQRLAAALDLLERRFAPLLIISLANSRHHHQALAGKAAAVRPGKVRLVFHQAPTLWGEAAEIRAALHDVICVRVVIVAPWYQARRTRLIFARTLKSDGTVVTICPVRPLLTADRGKSGQSRRAILLEPARLLGAWLHRGLPAEPHEAPADERKAA